MEFLGLVLLFLGSLLGMATLISTVVESHGRLSKIENRVAKLDGEISDVSDDDIRRVAAALSSKSEDDARAAILALRG